MRTLSHDSFALLPPLPLLLVAPLLLLLLLLPRPRESATLLPDELLDCPHWLLRLSDAPALGVDVGEASRLVAMAVSVWTGRGEGAGRKEGGVRVPAGWEGSSAGGDVTIVRASRRSTTLDHQNRRLKGVSQGGLKREEKVHSGSPPTLSSMSRNS